MTAWRLATTGKIPGAEKSPVGNWVVPIDEDDKRRTQTVAYARVSSHDQKADLDRQVARIAEWASANDLRIDRYVREIGSGLSEQRRELSALLADGTVETIVTEHRDRLARFGVAHIEKALGAQKRKIVVIDADLVRDDLVRDMIDLMTSFSARLYGRRAARNRAARAMAALRP